MFEIKLTTDRHIAMLLAVSCFIAACSPPPKVEVVERVTVNRNVEIDRIGGNLVRHVQPGDTLYSIAFDMGLNVNDIAAWNDLSDTSKLSVGKRIRLTKPIGFVAKPKPAVNKPVSDEKTDNIIVERPLTKEPPLAKQQPNPNISTAQKNISVPEKLITQPIFEKNITTWAWPLKGNIVRRFSQAKGQQGIDIGGQSGQAVVSANAGEVVYVGNSLKGYGNLIIIKHNDVFLSAYAHNSEIYVREGEWITAQQRIGSVGLNRNKEAALHFQIRRNGQPVNPLLYLSMNG